MARSVRSCLVGFLLSSIQVLARRDQGTDLEENLAEVARHEDSAADSDAHSIGLELEHDLNAKWTVTKEESADIKAMVESTLQGPGFDAPWNWEDEPISWTFGFVKLTSGEPQSGLAYHMLHRHGLAALIAANSEMGDFDEFLDSREGPSEHAADIDKADFLTKSLEAYPPAKKLFEFFTTKISLSALRNIHAYDHQWAWNGKKGDNCKRGSEGACVLQAGFSKQAYDLMSGGGFTAEVCKEMEDRMMDELYMGLHKVVTPHYTSEFAQATATGSIQNHELKVVRNTIMGTIRWEDGGRSDVQVPINPALKDRIRNDQSKMLQVVQVWIEQETRKYRKWFTPKRILFWAGEDAEFTQMYPQIS